LPSGHELHEVELARYSPGAQFVTHPERSAPLYCAYFPPQASQLYCAGAA